MKFSATVSYTTLAYLRKKFGDADEIVFKGWKGLDEYRVAEICRKARKLARHLHEHHPSSSAIDIAPRLGIEIRRESWEVAGGRIAYLGECTVSPPLIRINTAVIGALSQLAALWEAQEMAQWFSARRLAEVTASHELFHMIDHLAGGASGEIAAHCFAREFNQMPFSPLLYNELLARLGGYRRHDSG